MISAFRFTDLDLRDPHVFVNLVGCRDVTDTVMLGFSFNSDLQKAIQTDGDSDGYLDMTLLAVFRPLDQTGNGTMEVHVDSACTAPLAGTSCDSSSASVYTTTYTTSLSGSCLAALAGTAQPYSPAITSSTGPCFASGTFNLTLSLGGVPLTLRDASLAGTFAGNPSTGLVNGLMRGFVTEVDANTTFIPSGFPVIGGKTFASILPGGTGNCSLSSDKDMDNGVAGWWLYFNYVASPVAYMGP